MDTLELILLLVALAGYIIGVPFGMLIGWDLRGRSASGRRIADRDSVERNLLDATRKTFIR